jgi:malate dehydrogenase (oxaloacetate-decarboxylating)(NADP+)
MKLAAALAIANLAKEPVPDIVNKAYSENKLAFGKTYLIPKPLDPRLITTIAPAVAKAAMESGIAKTHIEDWEAYELDLQERIGIDQRLMSRVIARAKKEPKRVVFTEADNPKILKAAQIMRDEKIGIPILLGNKNKIRKLIQTNSLDLGEAIVIDPNEEKAKLKHYGQLLYDKRKRKGLTPYEAGKLMKDRNYFGAMMVETGEGDALISGLTKDYPRTILPSLQIIGVKKGVNKVAGMYIMNSDKGPLFFSDTTVNENPSADELVEIIGLTANGVRFFDIDPKIAILSYSNFGSAKGAVPLKTSIATAKAKVKYPELVIEGEMQANVALDESIQKENYPFSALINNKANTLIFPDLASGNIAYKLVAEIGNSEAIGPILLGMNKSVHILQLGSSIREIVNMVAIAVVDAQTIDSK